MSESPFRQALDAAIAEAAMADLQVSMKDLTVLAPQNDPFRVDTPARHRDGAWLAMTARDLGLGDRKIHLRGLHYMVIGREKPDGTAYRNTDADWLWLSGDAAKAARFLRYLPFDQITDQRNSEPVVRVAGEDAEPGPYLHARVHIDVPAAADIEPVVLLHDFKGVQPYRVVMIGEKSSLQPILGPLAEQYGTDLYLPTGEISDTHIHKIAKAGAEDGRPLIVLYFADCDPSGWQMPISVGRKLQAFKVGFYPELEFREYRVGLTPDQVREHDLPSTPLKDTEKRADKWQQATGVEQTEIDALASLRPNLLRQIARDAIAPFHDDTLDQRVSRVKAEWHRDAQAVVNAGLDHDVLERLRGELDSRLGELRAEIDAVNDALRINARDFDLPPTPAVPEPQVSGEYGVPLLDSRWSFHEQCQRLLASKAYRESEWSS